MLLSRLTRPLPLPRPIMAASTVQAANAAKASVPKLFSCPGAASSPLSGSIGASPRSDKVNLQHRRLSPLRCRSGPRWQLSPLPSDLDEPSSSSFRSPLSGSSAARFPAQSSTITPIAPSSARGYWLGGNQLVCFAMPCSRQGVVGDRGAPGRELERATGPRRQRHARMNGPRDACSTRTVAGMA